MDNVLFNDPYCEPCRKSSNQKADLNITQQENDFVGLEVPIVEFCSEIEKLTWIMSFQ